MSDFEYFKNTYGGGYPGFKLNQNRDQNKNYTRPEINTGTNIPNIKRQSQTNDTFFKKILLSIADNNKQINTKINTVSNGQVLLNLNGESIIRNVKGFENQVVTLLVASFNLQRLQAKYALDTKIGMVGINVNKYENLNSKIDNLITSIKSNKIVNKVGKVYNKTIGYEKNDFYDPVNMFTKYGGGIAAGIGAASLLYKVSSIIPKYTKSFLTGASTKFLDIDATQALLPAINLLTSISASLPALLIVSKFVSKRVKKYGKIDTERALEFEKNVKAKGNIFSDILSGKALFDLENRRTKGEFKATLGQRYAQAAIDLIGSSAKTAQLNTERVTYLRRVDREVSKVGIKPDMMKLITTPSAKLVTNIDTYEGKMVSLTSGVYDSLRFALLELVSIRSGLVGPKNKEVVDSNSLLSFLNRIDSEKAKREDRNVTNKIALVKNVLKAGALGALLGLPFGVVPSVGTAGMILGGTGAMAGYLGLKTSHSAFRRAASTKGGSLIKGAGVSGLAYLAANNPLLNQFGTMGLSSLGLGGIGAGLPGLLTGLLIASLVGGTGKFLFNKLKNRKELKFKQAEEEIEKGQERKYLSTLKLSTGISYSTAKLLTTPSRLVLGQLKNKDPHTQQMMLWGNIYDLMRNMATNINIVRQGTVGDFKQGENLLEFFEKSEKEKSEREDKHKDGIFGWKNKLKDFKPNLKHGALLSSIPIIMSLISGAGVLSPELAMAAVGGSLLSPIFKLGKKLYTDRRNKKEEEKLEKERLRNKAIEEFQRKIDEFTGKNKSDQKLANIALTSALPKIAEEQRLLLSKIYEVESNIYEVSSKLYVALTKDKDLKYRTHNISKKVYNINTGEYQSEKEYKETRNSALNELKNGLMQDIEREFIKSLNFRDIFLNEIQFKNKKNAFFDRYSDIPFRQNYENAIRGSKEESFRLNFKNPQAMQLPQKLNLDSKSFPNYTEILNTISEDIKAGLLSDKRKPLIREISASNDDEYCPDCLKELSKKLLEIAEASKKPAVAAYSGGIYNFSPKGQDTVPVGLEVGSAVIPREAVKRFSVAKKLGRVIHAQSGSYGVVPHGYVGAMVAPGEVVVPKEVVSANRPLVNGLVNAGRMIQKGKRLYSGGVINPNYYASGNADDEGFIFDKLKSLLKTGKNLLNKSIFSNLYDLNPVFALDLQHKIENLPNNKLKEVFSKIMYSNDVQNYIKEHSYELNRQNVSEILVKYLTKYIGGFDPGFLTSIFDDGIDLLLAFKNNPHAIPSILKSIFSIKNLFSYTGSTVGGLVGSGFGSVGSVAGSVYGAKLGSKIHDLASRESRFNPKLFYEGGYVYPNYYSIGNEELKEHYGNMAVGYYGDGANYIDIGKNKLSNLINVGRDNLSNLFNIGKDKLSGFGNNLANSILPGLTNNLVSPIATALSNLFIKVIKDMPNSAITKGLLITALGPVSIITELFFTAKEAISEYSKEYIKSGSILKSISSSIFSIFDTSGSGFINAFNKGTKYGAIGALIASAIPVPGANWVIGYILGAGVGGLLGWIEDGRLTEISRASLRKLDDIVMEPVNKFVDWFKDTFVSPIYEFIMKIKRWVNTKIGWIEPETATSQPQVKKSWLKYEGGLISSPKYYQQGKIDTTPNIQTEEERQDSRKEQIQEKQEEIQTTSLISISTNIKDLYNLMKEKLKPGAKEKEKVKPGFLSKLIGLGLAGYAIWKLAGPYIKEMFPVVFDFLKNQVIEAFTGENASTNLLISGGVLALLFRKQIGSLVLSTLTFVSKNIWKVLTKTPITKLLPFAGIVTAISSAFTGFIEEYNKSGSIGSALWEGFKNIFAVGKKGGVWDALEGAGKYGSYGAGIGTLIGGPVGFIIGGLAGAAIGGLLGWIGQDRLNEIGRNVYAKLDEYIIQPVSNFFEWFTKNVFEPLKGYFNSITNFIADKLRVIGIDFSTDEQKQLRQEIQSTPGNKLDLKSLQNRSAVANFDVNKELEKRYQNIAGGLSNLEDIKKAFIEGKSIYRSDLEALGVFTPQEINDLVQKKSKYLVDIETQKGETGWLFKKTPEQRIQEKQQYDENQEKLRRSQLIKQNLLIDETETKYSGGVISPKYYIEGTPEVKYIKEKSEKLLNDILSIKDEKKRQELYDSFTNTESYKLLSLKSKQIFDDLVKLKSTLSKDDIIYLKDEFVKNYSSVTDNINSLLLDYIDKHPNVTTQFKELRESLINGFTLTVDSVTEQLEKLSSNYPDAKKQIEELRLKIVESTSGGMTVSADFLNKQLEDLKLAYPGLKNQLQDLQVNLVKSASKAIGDVSTGISDLLNSKESGFKGFVEDIFKNGLDSEYTDPMNVKKSFQKHLFENPAGKMAFNAIDRATRIGNDSDEWPPGSEGWTEKTFKRNKSMFDDRITNIVGVVKNSKGEILKIKEIKKGPWVDVFWDEKVGKYERNRQVSNQLPDFSISDNLLNKDYLTKYEKYPIVNSEFVGPPTKFGSDVKNTISRSPINSVRRPVKTSHPLSDNDNVNTNIPNIKYVSPNFNINAPKLASGGIIDTQSREDTKKFFIEVISESKIQFNDEFNKMFKNIHDKIVNKSNITSTDRSIRVGGFKSEETNSESNKSESTNQTPTQIPTKNQPAFSLEEYLKQVNSIDFGKTASDFSNMMNPEIMIGRLPTNQYSGGIIFPNYFAEGGVVTQPTVQSYGSSIDLDELSKYINYTASTPYKQGIGGLSENTQKKFFQLAKEFYNQTGKKLNVTSAYRSSQLQAKLKAKTSNTKLVGSAGRSQHNHGYALDIDYRGKDPTTWNSSPQGKYINDSGLAKKYGFAIGPNTLAREAWHMEDTDSLTRKDKSAMQKAMELSLSGKTGYEIDKILRGGSSQYNTTGFNTSDNINIPGYQQFTPGSSTQQSSFIGSEAGSTSSSPNIPDIAGQIGNMQSSLSSIFGGGQVSAGGASATFRTPNIPGVDISSIGTGTPSSFGSTSPIGTTSSINATSPTGTSNTTSPTGTSSGGVNFGGGSFNQKAPGIMKQLMSDFGLNEIQAAAILGNLGHESGGFKYAQELNPRSGRGGYGWAQWTGSRRKAFESWASQNGLNINSDAANYGFLKHELQTTHKNAISALKQTNSLDAGVQAFERVFERAGVKHYESRNKYANSALESYKAGGGQVSPSSGMSSGSDVASMGSGGGGSGAQTESGSTSSSPSMPDIAGQINSMQSSLSNAFGGGQVSVGGASATFRTPNVPGATQSPTPAVSQITPPSLETSQSEEDIKVPEASSPGISHEPQKTQLQPEYNVKTGSDPQVLSSGVHTSVDPVSNNIFMWLCDLTGRSLMFGALSQATGQMPFPVVDGSRII